MEKQQAKSNSWINRRKVLKAGDEAIDTVKAIQEIQKQTGIKLTYDKVNKVWMMPARVDYGLGIKKSAVKCGKSNLK